jgi:hypothetical protein
MCVVGDVSIISAGLENDKMTGENTSLAKLDRVDQIADMNLLTQSGVGRMRRALMVADTMQELREILTDELLRRVAMLQGTDLGFRTDRDEKGGYKPAEIRDVLIEASIRGYSPTGNEFNIIAGKFYATKSGLQRKVREFPGLSDLEIREGVPYKTGEGALCEMHAQWKLNGVHQEIHCEDKQGSDTRIPVRVNANMGVDAILGKATRKLLARIWSRLNGSQQSLAPGESEIDEQQMQSDGLSYEEAVHRLDASQTLQEVADIVAEAALRLDDASIASLEEHANALRERIRSQRGQRANKQPQAV